MHTAKIKAVIGSRRRREGFQFSKAWVRQEQELSRTLARPVLQLPASLEGGTRQAPDQSK